MGFEDEEARKRAYLAYCILMGDSILNGTLSGMDTEEFAEKALQITADLDKGAS